MLFARKGRCALVVVSVVVALVDRAGAQAFIQSAVPDETLRTLTIKGGGFNLNPPPEVYLESTPLSLSRVEPSELVAQLPAVVAAGSYSLIVFQGGATAVFYVGIGALGRLTAPPGVTSAMIAGSAVTSADILNGQVGATDLALDPATRAELTTHEHDDRYFSRMLAEINFHPVYTQLVYNQTFGRGAYSWSDYFMFHPIGSFTKRRADSQIRLLWNGSVRVEQDHMDEFNNTHWDISCASRRHGRRTCRTRGIPRRTTPARDFRS